MKNNNTPLVSIILPTYNREHVISRSIDSVISQTYSNFELIIVDDGSTDNTSDILKKYEGKVEYIKQKNSGVSSARNTGIKLAKGEYIAFIDSDDQWLPTKLQRQIEYFMSHSRDGLSMVCTDVTIIDTDGNPHERRRFMPKTSSCLLDTVDIFKDPYLGLPTVILKSCYLTSDNVFDESLRSAEDIDLYLRLSLSGKAGYLHEKLVNIHQSHNSLSDSITSYDDNIHVITRFLNQHEELFSPYQTAINRVMHNVMLDYAKTLLWTGSKEKSRSKIKLAIRYKLSLTAVYLYLKSYLK